MRTGQGDVQRKALLLETLTLVWCVVEAGVALAAGIAAGSIALVAFGADSAIEILAALVVIWQLRGVGGERRRRAMGLMALTFFLLGAYAIAASARDLLGRTEAAVSLPGIAVTAASALVMPLLAWGKHRVGKALSNPVLLADSKESLFCALFSLCALLGLALRATLGWWWADPAAAIGIALLAWREGVEAWEEREESDEEDAGGAAG